MDVSNSTVVVTGGQRGLGRALVDALLAQGANKVYATARTPHASDDPRIVPLALEVTNAASVAELAARAADASIVINNAGVSLPTPLLDVQIDAARDVFEVNVLAPLRVAQAFAPVLALNGGGALVNIASVLSWAGGTAAYGASKAALWSLTNSLRVELAEQRTQVVGAHLSFTDTDMTARLDLHKNTASDVATSIVDAIAAGATEVLCDDDSRRAKALLSGLPEGLAYTVIGGRMAFAAEAS
jgi:NAD(P)-dependent dehydrogenase (short-subunit alcohol dehydrogenase family)